MPMGVSIGANALTLNSGTIKDAVGNDANLTHSAVSDDSGHKVDTEPPKIISGSSDDQGASGSAGASGAVGFARALNTVVVSNGVEITSSGALWHRGCCPDNCHVQRKGARHWFPRDRIAGRRHHEEHRLSIGG